MATSPITATSTVKSTLPELDRIPLQTLGQHDFLQLLVTQLTTQDPLNPQTDTEFIAQMAQFSALEQAKSTQAEMRQIRQQQDRTEANGLLGQTVQVVTGNGSMTSGVVSAVWLEGDEPKLLVNGNRYNLGDVHRVERTPAEAAPPPPDWSADFLAIRAQQQILQASALIGQTVVVQSAPGMVEPGVVTGVELQSGWPRLVVNGNSYDLSQVTRIGASHVENP